MCFSICVCWVQEDTAHAIPCDGRARQQCCVSWRGVLGGEIRIDVLLRSVVRLCRHGGRGAGGGPLPRCHRSCPMRAAIGGGQEPSRGPGREGEAGGRGTGGGQYILTTRTQRAGLANRADARRVRRTGGRCAVGGGRCAANGTAVMREDSGRGQRRGGGEAALLALRAAPPRVGGFYAAAADGAAHGGS